MASGLPKLTSIRAVSVKGLPELVPVTVLNMGEVMREFPESDWAYITSILSEDRDAWVAADDFGYLVETNFGKMQVNFRRGWPTDLGSVPAALRSIVSHSDPTLTDAYLLHDAAYGTGALSFRESNELLYGVAKLADCAWMKLTLVYAAVSRFGYSAYVSSIPKRSVYSRFVEFTVV